MSSEHEFRNKLKGLLEEQTYTYEDFNWEKARKVLDREDAKKRRGFIFWILGGACILVGLLCWYFIGAVAPQQPMSLIKENSEIKYPEHKAETILVPQKQGQNLIKKEPEQKDIKPKEASEPNSPVADTKTKVKEKILQNSSSRFLRSDGNEASIKQRKEVSPQISSGVDEDRTRRFDSPSILPQTPGKFSTGEVSQPDETKEGSDERKVQVEIGKAPAEVPPSKKSDAKDDNERAIVNLATVIDSSSSPKLSSKDQPISPALADKNVAQETVIAKEEAPFAKTDSIVGTDSSLVKKKGPALADSVKSALQPTLQVTGPVNYFYAEGGTYLNFGWNVNGKHEGLGFNPYFGLSYVFLLSDKTSVTLGGYYYTINRLKSSKTIKSTEVIFGEVSDVTEITPSRFNYIAVPIKFQYNLGENGVLTAGASFAYLLDVQSRVRTYHETYNATENESTHWSGGYREGIRTFNNQISLGYRRKLYQNLWVNAEFLFGITDIRDNNFFNIDKKELAHGLKLSLSYNLIKK
ncbi:MAG: hypothetical protein JNL60_08190 [Bacteroidia bacterium]|nr:hypothetical protein [Bacteroidia bacterium]